MRIYWKQASMMRKDGHHQMKRKLFKKRMLRSMFEEGDMSCKKKHFKRMMKNRYGMAPGHHGKRRHFKGHSSSDSDDSHHGKRKHFKHMMKHCSPTHHGKFKHSRGKPGGYSSSSESDDNDQHYDKRNHFMGMPRRCRSASPFGDHHSKHYKGIQGRSITHSRDVHQECMSSTEKNQCSKDTQGQSMYHSGDVQQGKETGCMSSTEKDSNSKDIQGQSMDKGCTEKGHHSKGIEGRSVSYSDDEEFQRPCMSDNGRKHYRKMSKREGCMTDLEDGHHGRGRHFRGMGRRHMFIDHGKEHKHGKMHHFKRRHWMKWHDESGFFGEDSALVPICAIDLENLPETVENEASGKTNDAAETGIEDTARTREQGTQTTGIMEIVIEDQEAQNAAISIVNKFL